MFDRTPQPFDGTATERRKLRQEVRNTLGVSHESAPDLVYVLRAVQTLRRLLELTTGGRYSLKIDNRSSLECEPVEATIKRTREQRDAARQS